MLKIVLLIVIAAIIAFLLLEIRQQRIEYNYQTNTLYDQIEQCQAKLWNQQLQIAMYTAPNAIARTVDQKDLHLVRPTPTRLVQSDTSDAAE
jgi:cell division protein FtsL